MSSQQFKTYKILTMRQLRVPNLKSCSKTNLLHNRKIIKTSNNTIYNNHHKVNLNNNLNKTAKLTVETPLTNT
jgi:hypothetical protein